MTLHESRGDYRDGVHEIKLADRGRYDGLWLTFAKAIQGEKPLDFDSQHNLVAQRTLLKACGMLT